jgi:hypothetical protein
MWQKCEMDELCRDPAKSFSTVGIPGTKIGAAVSLGLAAICWIGFPVARLFILGTAGLALILGVILYWKPRN